MNLKEKLNLLQEAVKKEILKGNFFVTGGDEYTKEINVEGISLSLWVANGPFSLRTYSGNYNDISLEFGDEIEDAFLMVKNTAHNPITIEQIGNDLFFKNGSHTVLTGYNDANWWNNVFHEAKDRLGIVEVEGNYYIQ